MMDGALVVGEAASSHPGVQTCGARGGQVNRHCANAHNAIINAIGSVAG
jgi:hypothetical protein